MRFVCRAFRALARVAVPGTVALSLSAPPAVCVNPGVSLPQSLEDTMASAFGSRVCGPDSMHSLLVRKLSTDAGPHTLAMQQRVGLPEHQSKLRHQSLDHCDALGKCIKVGGHPDRQVVGFTSAETRGVHAIAVVPNTQFSSMKNMTEELNVRKGGAAKFTVIDNMPMNRVDLETTLVGTMCGQDLNHYQRRYINTLDPSATTFAGACSLYSGNFLRLLRPSAATLERALTTPGGIAKGGRVMLEAATDSAPCVMKTFKANESTNGNCRSRSQSGATCGSTYWGRMIGE